MDALHDQEQALKEAIAHVGGPAELARKITELTGESITTQAISQWRRAPSVRTLQIESACDGVVSRHRLRSDLYPEPSNENQSRRDADRRREGAT